MDDTLEGGSSALAAAIAEPGGKRDSTGESREQTQLCVKTARKFARKPRNQTTDAG